MRLSSRKQGAGSRGEAGGPPAGEIVVSPAEGPDALLASLVSLPGVRGTMLSTKDGIAVRSALPRGVYPDTVSIMSATMFGAAQTATRESLIGSPRRIVVDSEEGGLVILDGGGPDLATLFTSEEPERAAELAAQVLRRRG